jgi:nucleotide-binding universal stress UspA family protein
MFGNEESAMANPVVVGVDDAASTGAAVAWAADEAALTGARLHLVHAWQWDSDEGAGSLDATLVRESGERSLDALVQQAKDRHEDLHVSSASAEAPPRKALTTVSADARLLVVGSRGLGGFPGLLTGSTSLHVAAHAACPVVVVPSEDWARVGGVCVGLHRRGADEPVLSFAFETARQRKLPLRVVHTWSYRLLRLSGSTAPPVYEAGHAEEEQVRMVDAVLADWRTRYPDVAVEADVVRSNPAKRLVALSEGQQLVIVGREGNPDGPVRRLGSVSQAVVQHAKCPVAVVPIG